MALKFVEITFNNIKTEIEYFLQVEHNKHNIQFSEASPYGQILSVLENLHQLCILYLKNTIDQFDINSNNNTNDRIVRNAAIVAGHNPTRAISATGTLKITLKSSADNVPGNKMTLYNRALMKNNNGLYYSTNLGVEKMTYDTSTSDYILFIPIIQGQWKSINRTGDGSVLQTFNISENAAYDIENFNVEIRVNGEYWTIKPSLYDMLPDEKSCVIKSGYNNGIDIMFGNGSFGKIPEIASTITINYLKTNGANGNIFTRVRNDFKFIDDVYDAYGNTFNIGEYFNIDTYNDISFGANKESIEFTRALLPIVSNNFVLATAEQYSYAIRKLEEFSYVNAYEKSGTIFVVASPNVLLFRNSDADYFNIEIGAFYIDNYEINKIYKFLRTSGNIQLTKKVRIKSPVLSYYVINIDVIPYSDVLDEDIKSEIRATISNYFLSFTRTDRIPKLDIIKSLSTIDDIYSIDIDFICKKNEDYHIDAIERFNNMLALYNGDDKDNLIITDLIPDYDPSKTLGLDDTLGDIIFEPSELPICRGGWKDRYGIYYDDTIDSKSNYKAINITIKSKIDSAKRNTK